MINKILMILNNNFKVNRLLLIINMKVVSISVALKWFIQINV